MSYRAGSVIIDIRADTANLVTGMQRAQRTVTQSVNMIKDTLITLSSAYAGFSGVEKILRTGFTFNKQMEDSIASLTSLAVATSSNISAMGKYLSIAEKYNLAQKEAIKTTKGLQAINFQTPHSLIQTIEIYKTMYVTMKKAGATNEQMIDLTRKLSIASAAGGVKFQELLAGVDGISTGTVLANSNLGRFLSSLGLTNKALKGTKDVVKLVEDRLSQMKSLDTMTVAVSNLDNAWQQLAGDITKEAFTESKQSVKDLTKTLNDNKADIVEFGLDTIRTAHLVANGFETIFLNSTLGYQELAYTFKDEIGSAINYVIDELQTTNNWWANTWIGKKAGLEKMNLSHIKVDAHALNTEIINSKAHMYELGVESDKLLHKILTNTQAQKKYNKTVKDGKQDRLVGTKQSPVVDEKAILKKHREEIKALKEKNKLEQQAYAIYTSIMSTNYEKWLQDASDKMAKLAESGAFTDKQLLNVWDTMQKDYEMKIEIKGIDKAQSQMDKMYDTQINLMQNGLDWGNSLTGVSQKIANAGKAFTQYTLANMKSEKAEADMSSKYSKDWLKIENSKITAKEKEAQQTALYGNFKKNIDKDQAVRHSAELAAVANLAGSMASMYEQGSAKAIAFTAVQSALGIAAGWSAINQAWSEPGTLSMKIAAAAMVASNVLPIIAQLSGSGGGGGAKAPTREDVYKKKADDYKASTKPITDRLDRQIELLKSISGYGGDAIAKEITQAKATYNNDSHADNLNALGKIGETNTFRATQNKRIFFTVQHYHEQSTISGDSVGSAAHERALAKKYSNYVTPTIYGSMSLDPNVTFGSLDINKSTRASASKLVDFLQKLNKNKNLSEFGVTEQEYKDIINQAEKTAHDFSMSIINSYKEIINAGKSFKDDYDSLFNNFYKNSQLQTDRTQVDKLRGGTSLGDYLKTTITAIDKIKAKLSAKNMALLESEDPKDLVAKIALNKKLEKAYGKSTAEAINNIDAINNVAKAMANSKNNSKSFLDSFKTQAQLAQELAKVQGVTLATSTQGLMTLYRKLKNDTDGLTSADLNLLNANKALLEQVLKKTETEVDTQEYLLTTTQQIADKIHTAMYNATKATYDYANSLQSITELSTGLSESFKTQGMNSKDSQFYYTSQANKYANDTSHLLDNNADPKEIRKAYSELVKYAGNLYKLNPDSSGMLKGRIDSINKRINNTADILKVQVTDSVLQNINFLTPEQLKTLGLSKETTLATLAMNGVNAHFIVDDRGDVTALIAKDFTIKVGEQWSDVSTELTKGFLWNMPPKGSALAEALASEYNWTGQQLTDATTYLDSHFDWTKDVTNTDVVNALAGEFNWAGDLDTKTVKDAMTKVDKDYNWNIPKNFSDILTSLNKSFDWDGDGLTDAVKEVMPNGETKLKFDWNHDGKVDLSAIFSKDGQLTEIVKNTAHTKDVAKNTAKASGHTISSYLELLYKQNKALIEKDTRHLDASSFKVGHHLGEQENVDMAKDLGTNNFAEFYKLIKGFDAGNKSQDKTLLASMLSKHPEYKAYFKDLEKHKVLPKDVIEANKSLKQDSYNAREKENNSKHAKYDKIYDQYHKLYTKYMSAYKSEQAVLDKIKSQPNSSNKWDAYYMEMYSPRYDNVTKYHKAMQTYQKNTLDPASDAYTKFKKTLVDKNGNIVADPNVGFATGGYTGNMGVNNVAGVVHGQEYVVNARTTKDLGLNGTGGVFNKMLAEIEKLNTIVANQNMLIEANANETKTMRKEIQDQSDYLIGIEEKIA